MLYEIMLYLRNFFPRDERFGNFEIKGGVINLPFLAEGEYFLVQGSRFNDGVYMHPFYFKRDEKFNGSITVLNPPNDFLSLVDDITEWQIENGKPQGQFESESFADYSYTRAKNSKGEAITWQDAFKTRLNIWRKR